MAEDLKPYGITVPSDYAFNNGIGLTAHASRQYLLTPFDR
jgi:hypothetical protein